MEEDMHVKKIHNKGNHLLIDIYNCKNRLDNKEEITNFLLSSIKKINMRAISSPLVIDYKADIKEESGVTGIIILAESHISIHTYPHKNFASIDIYSCNEFEYEKLIEYIRNNFKTEKVKTKLIKRPL